MNVRAEGPFSVVRHPIYLGWGSMAVATPTMTTSRLPFAVVSTLYLVLAVDSGVVVTCSQAQRAPAGSREGPSPLSQSA
ncbi:MAG TPA: hypothetical protein VEA16_19370 [Vicinamibacterales bacterium]|nr:hypothetical protein [Vicinamibacterales bacterium]